MSLDDIVKSAKQSNKAKSIREPVAEPAIQTESDGQTESIEAFLSAPAKEPESLVRLNIEVSRSLNNDLKKLATNLGVTKRKLVSVALQDLLNTARTKDLLD